MTASVISEIHEARSSAGISQRDLGRAVGVSASQVARFERGQLRDIRIDQLCRLGAGVGLDVSVRMFPGGDPIRDIAQVRLLERVHDRLDRTARFRIEVPLDGRTDLRAWDAVIDRTGCVDALEAETRLRDLQATTRRIDLKIRDDPTVRHVILVIADTRHNRAALAASRASLRDSFPLDTRDVMIRLAAGRCPGANGIVVI